MKCIEARRMVTSFVKKELTDKETEEFLKHIEHCDDCMEELDIYYTMHSVFDTLDSGKHHDYNFKKMLANEIRASHYAIIRRKMTRGARFLIMMIAEVLLVFCVYTGYEMRKGEMERSTFEKALSSLNNIPYRLNLIQKPVIVGPHTVEEGSPVRETELQENIVIFELETEMQDTLNDTDSEPQTSD